MKYRKKPIEVEALQIHRNVEEIKEFIGENGDAYTGGNILDRPHTVVLIDTLEGIMRATDGDYIIKRVKGEFYPCRKDIFEETYELVDGGRQMIVDCPNCGSYTRFTLKLTNKMNLKCICTMCGHGFKVKLAKSEKKLRFYKEVETNDR